ncbi:uncharacterized protein LOC125945590 [Dermacentor silvarum]|uniref:uncharacterized protein LOC125945590 n=1 Tax=Dermacentor silvarum TaxID=543639 RepID=UPI0021010AA8|nr:uncharacterized protein LOC125945590 [Dermacentor silvarum]
MANLENAAMAAPVPDRARQVQNLLVDLEGARGFFSGKVIDYRMVCTAAEDRACQIVANLSVWNEFLHWIDLELRELPGTGRQLGLERVYHMLNASGMHRQVHQAATVLFWLLNNHRCVARMSVPYSMTEGPAEEVCVPVLCEGLANSSLKSLTLEALSCAGHEKVWKVILSMKCLEELNCPFFFYSFPDSVLSLLQTKTLTALHFSIAPPVKTSLSRLLLTALKGNTTLRALSINSDVLNGDADLVVEFLVSNHSLQELTVVAMSSSDGTDYLKWVFKGMLKNKSVSSLRVDSLILDFENAELVAKMLAENKVLRRFELSHSTLTCINAFLLDFRNTTVPPNTITWQEAISRNDTLQYMTLDFDIWSAEHWGAFFLTLSKHASLRLVTIVVTESQYDMLSPVVKAFERSDCEDKVFFKATCNANSVTLPACKRCFELDAFVSDYEKITALPVFLQLSTFSHLSKLSVRISNWDNEICSVIPDYVATTSTLRKLHLQLSSFDPPPGLGEWWQAVSRSLLLNRSIADLGVGSVVDSGENIGLLGAAVKRSPTIRKLRLFSFKPLPLDAFLRGLHADIFENNSLCNVVIQGGERIPPALAAYWFDVCNTARRNSGFVVRASRFLNDARSDRLSAAALDRVSRHPALIAELAKVLSMGEVETAHLVRQRFENIQGLHEFMRLAGVVKERVTCQPHEDGRPQLDALDSECWSRVRRYLQLYDVAYGRALLPSP